MILDVQPHDPARGRHYPHNWRLQWLSGRLEGRLAMISDVDAEPHVVRADGAFIGGPYPVSAWRVCAQILGGEVHLKTAGLKVGHPDWAVLTIRATSRSATYKDIEFKIGDGHPMEPILHQYLTFWAQAPASLAIFNPPEERGLLWGISRSVENADSDFDLMRDAWEYARAWAGYADPRAADSHPECVAMGVGAVGADRIVYPLSSKEADARAALFVLGARAGCANVLLAGHSADSIARRWAKRLVETRDSGQRGSGACEPWVTRAYVERALGAKLGAEWRFFPDSSGSNNSHAPP